jgi:hypothetical protein
MNKSNILLALIMCVSCGLLNAQTVEKSVVASAGNSYSGSAIMVDWTVGQPRINYSASSILVTEGFHPIDYSGSTPTGMPAINKENPLVVTAYPNPVSNMLHVTVQQANAAEINGQVTDVAGNTINTFSMPAGVNTAIDIDLSAVAPGTYLVELGNSKDNMQVMKIVKK